MEERIQKIISAAGVTSRRAAEQLITEGRVRVNGQVVTELGAKADANKDHIKVDGKLINPHQPLTYIMLNKPAGFVTTMADPEGRPTVQALLKGVKQRVYPVGRLDYNTEGLLLMTNDGDFAHLITHPKHELPKTYRAKVKGFLEDRQIAQLEEGIYLDDGKTAPARVKKISKEEANSWLDITIHEGRKRQVRRMFDRTGHSVIKLKRIKIGNLTLGDLPEGAFRHLDSEEVRALKEFVEKEPTPVVVRKEIEHKKLPELQQETRETAPARRSYRETGAPRQYNEQRLTPGRRPSAAGDRPQRDSRPSYSRSADAPKRFGDQRPAPGRRPSAAGDRPQRDSRPSYSRSADAPKRFGDQRPAPGRRPSAADDRPQRDRRPPYSRGSDAPKRYGDHRAMPGRGPGSFTGARPGTSRIAGQGASGRGLRRPPRDSGNNQAQGSRFPDRSRAMRSESGETPRRSAGPRRPEAGSWSQAGPRRVSLKPGGNKTASTRLRGKVFDSNTEPKQKAGWKARSGDRDQTPRRPYERGDAGKTTIQGASRKPYRTRK